MKNQPHIIVFYNKLINERCRFFIKQLEKHGFEPKVDAVHYRDYSWFQKNCVESSYCLFLLRDQKIFSFQLEDLNEEMIFSPDFGIFYNHDVVRSSEEWLLIKRYLTSLCEFETISNEEVIQAKELISPADKIFSDTLGVKEMPRGSDPNYYFRTHHLEDQDIMLYEVKKPNTDLPYTTVTKNYSIKGHTPFFTDLFICDSWGVARSDIGFLKNIWKFLAMEGEFDLDTLMKNATEKCYPSDDRVPEAEPQVYRRDLESVVDRIDVMVHTHTVPEHIMNKN